MKIAGLDTLGENALNFGNRLATAASDQEAFAQQLQLKQFQSLRQGVLKAKSEEFNRRQVKREDRLGLTVESVRIAMMLLGAV